MPQSANSESDPAIPHQNPDTSTLQGITNHRKEIVWNSFVVTIPISALTVAFLLLVFRYRVKTGDSPLKNLRLPSDEGDKNAVYVDLNSSYILFVASRASSLGTLLTGFILTLVSFPIARQLSRDIQMGRVDSLPTPYQLALLLKFLDGSAPGAIWGWIVYLFSWRKTRQPQSSALIAASSTASAALILGVLLSMADTWLHLTTTTVPFTRVSPVIDKSKYSFGLVPRCLESNNSIPAGLNSDGSACSIAMGNSIFLSNSTLSLQALSNISSESTVYTHVDFDGKPYTYLGIPPQSSQTNHDFTARTYGANAECSLISQQCNLHAAAAIIGYNCSRVFNGSLTDRDLVTGFFTDKTMRTKCDFTTPYYSPTEAGNPYYLALTTIQTTMGERPGGLAETAFVQNLHGGLAFILGCNMTIYDIEYDRVNGSVTRFQTQPSNTSVSNVWQTSMAYVIEWKWAMKQAVGSAFQSTGTGQQFADSVALALSQTNLAMGAQGVEAREVVGIQERTTSLVARVPIAPLVALVVLCALFTVAGIGLTISAVWAARNEVPDLKARLGISGLVADRFEGPGLRQGVHSVDDFFDEYAERTDKRVAIERRDETENYRYTLWEEKSEGCGRPEIVTSSEDLRGSLDH